MLSKKPSLDTMMKTLDKLKAHFFLLSDQGEILYCNQLAQKKFLAKKENIFYINDLFSHYYGNGKIFLENLNSQREYGFILEKKYPGAKEIIEWNLVKVDDNDKLYNILTGFDISKHYCLEKKVSCIENRLQSVINSIAGNHWWKDLNGVYRSYNQFLLDTLGLRSFEVIGKTDYELPWNDQADKLIENDKMVISSGKPLQFEENILTQKGERKTFFVTKVPFKDDDGQIIGTIGTAIDITDKIKLEKKFLKVKAKVAANQAKSEFIANMSHDIRTPLTGLLGMAQAIYNRTIEKEIKQDANLLIHCAEELLNLFNEIIELIQVESGKVIQREKVFSLMNLLQHNISLLNPAAKHKKIELNMKISPETPDYIESDNILLDRIILHLLSNAVKFTKQGKVELSASAEKLDNERFVLKIAVEDTGIGIPTDKFEKIFEHFSRLTPSYKGIFQGTGLGLYTVKRYLKVLNGNIHMESKVGKGSLFVVTMPVRKVKKQIHREKISLNASATRDLRKEPSFDEIRILVVEDQQIAAKMAASMLENLGCFVDCASSGEEAVKMVNQYEYDMIFMDIGLPQMDGLSTAKCLRAVTDQRKKVTPIIALTAHMSREKHRECLEAGMQTMLVKPLTKAAAKETIEKFIYPLTKKQQVTSEKNAEPDIDMNLAINLASGRVDFARELLSMLVRTLPEDFEKIQSAYFKKDWGKLYFAIHRLYGALCYCGVPKLQRAAKRLKESAQEKKETKIKSSYQKLSIAIEQFLSVYHKLND